MDGNINGYASPKIKVAFQGMLSEASPPQFYDAIIDTGFTGSVSIPITQALPLGLVLFSTASFTLADGSKEDTFLCIGMAIVENKKQRVIFSLTQGRDILIGTEFLSMFHAKLKLDYKDNTYSLTV